MSPTSLVFVSIFCGGLLLGFLRHPMYSLATYVFVFYFNPPSRWWGVELPDLRWALIAGAAAAVASLRLPTDEERPGWLSQTPARILVVYAAWVWVQQIWALNPDVHLYFATLLTKYIVAYYLIYRIVRTPEDLGNFLLAHVIGCLYLGWLASTAEYSGRLEGVGGPGIDEANALAMQMATGVASGAMLILLHTGWKRWICVLAMPFLLDTIIMSGSRSGFLAVITVSAVIWLLRPTFNRRLFRVFAICGVFLFLAVASVQFWERMATLKTVTGTAEVVEESALSRRVLFAAQLQMAAKYPLGTGHRGTEVLSPDYLDERWLTSGENPARSSHNTFMTAWVEQGIPGLLLYIGLWLWVLRASWRAARFRQIASPAAQAHLAAVTASLAAVFVAGMFVDYARAEVQFWMLPLLAILATTMKTSAHRPAINDEVAEATRATALPAGSGRFG